VCVVHRPSAFRAGKPRTYGGRCPLLSRGRCNRKLRYYEKGWRFTVREVSTDLVDDTSHHVSR